LSLYQFVEKRFQAFIQTTEELKKVTELDLFIDFYFIIYLHLELTKYREQLDRHING